jgi:hypothetical protein
LELIFKHLDSDDERYEKKGLQDLCELLEKGYVLAEDTRNQLYLRLSKFQSSGSILVRRWLYKSIGLLNEKYFLPFLTGQLSGRETDLENQSWVVAALYHLETETNAHKIIIKSHISSDALLSAGYYEPTFLPHKKETIKKILDDNNALSLKWFSLLYGNSLDRFQIDSGKLKDYLTRLNLHEDNRVAEYSIWALHKTEHDRFTDCLILPHQISNQSPNIRRWLYRLITKDLKGIAVNYELLKSAITSELDISAREGLATGLGKFSASCLVVPLYCSWFRDEKNSFVRIQLLRNISENAKDNIQYQKILINEIANPFDQISKHIAQIGLSKIKLTEPIQTKINLETKTLTEMTFQKIDTASFEVAVSFPGEKREYVLETVEELSKLISKKDIFYDHWYTSQLARPNLDTLLQDIYHNKTKLIVVFLCEDYQKKKWCGIEWKSIRDLMNQGNDLKIMLMSFDFFQVKGTFATTDGLVDVDKLNPIETASLIHQRLMTM